MSDYVISAFLTWLFWLMFSLINFSFLFWIPFFPFVFLAPIAVRIFPFVFGVMLVPLLFSIFVTLIVGMIFAWRFQNIPIVGKVLILNMLFLIALVTSTNVLVGRQINAAISELPHDCFEKRGFLSSLSIAGQEYQFETHAYYRDRGVYYAWSYSEESFFELPNSISRNLNFQNCYG